MVRVFAVLVVLAALVSPAFGQSLTDEQIQDAISRAPKYNPLVLGETLNLSATGYRIEVYSPLAWIRLQARLGKEELRPFALGVLGHTLTRHTSSRIGGRARSQ